MVVKDWIIRGDLLVSVAGNFQSLPITTVRLLESIKIVGVGFNAWAQSAVFIQNNSTRSLLSIVKNFPNDIPIGNNVANQLLTSGPFAFSSTSYQQFFFDSISGDSYKNCSIDFSAGDTLSLFSENTFASSVPVGQNVINYLRLYTDRDLQIEKELVWEK